MRDRKPFFYFALAAVAIAIFVLAGCKEDATTTPPGATVTPITDDLFPLTVGHKFYYTGFATAPRPVTGGGGDTLPDPGNVYRTIWTVGPPVTTPLGGAGVALFDTTTLYANPPGFPVTFGRTLIIRKDSASGDFFFMQTIGPFKRAFGITIGSQPEDTLVFLAIARASQGVGGTGAQWTAYDSTFSGTGGVSVRLQIFGRIETQETITDSSATPTQHSVYRSRTWRRITVGGTIVQDDATTSILWLKKDFGPVQVRIVEDTENIGHWRFLTSANF